MAKPVNLIENAKQAISYLLNLLFDFQSTDSQLIKNTTYIPIQHGLDRKAKVPILQAHIAPFASPKSQYRKAEESL